LGGIKFFIYMGYKFYANGKLLRYEREQDEHVHNIIADSLYKDITAKTALGLPTTGKDFEKHIMQVTPENVFDVLADYAHTHKETLLDAVNFSYCIRNFAGSTF